MLLFSTLAGQALWTKWLLREGKEKSQHYTTLGPLHLLEWRELGKLCVLQKRALCSTGLRWPYLTPPQHVFSILFSRPLTCAMRSGLVYRLMQKAQTETPSNIMVFTTRETFGPMVQVQQ